MVVWQFGYGYSDLSDETFSVGLYGNYSST